MPEHLFFLHIPKTAGMSVHRLLEGAITPYVHLQHPHELAWPAALVYSRFRGCGGHLTGASARRNGFMDAYTVTFLREPIARLLSQYDFSLDESFSRSVDGMLSRKYEIRKLVELSEGYLGSFWNAQTYALSGEDYTASPAEHLKSALSNLEAFHFIGLVDHFTEDATDLVRRLGGTDAKIPHENRGVRRSHLDELDHSTRKLLEEKQALDQELYRRAIQLRSRRVNHPRIFQFTESAAPSWPPLCEHTGTGEAEIIRIEVKAADGQPRLQSGQPAEIVVDWTADHVIPDLILGLRIDDSVGNYIAGTNSSLLTGLALECEPGANRSVFRFCANMGPGRYILSVALHQNAKRVCWLDAATVFEIAPSQQSHQEGMVDICARFVTASAAAWHALGSADATKIALHVDESRIELAGASFRIPIRLTNPTDAVLSSDEPSRIHVSYHWIDAEGHIRVFDGARTRLPEAVWPQSAAKFDVAVVPPPGPGFWTLQLRLVQEAVRWHEGPGFEQVTPPDLHFHVDHRGAISFEPHAAPSASKQSYVTMHD